MIFNAAANSANINDGAPQVSILASASAKRMQERRRQSRLSKNAKGMGVGKKYPGVGTHHRNTKHVWLYSELAEVSAAYKEHHTTMPLWTIADMLYYSFSQQLKHNQANIAEVDQQDQPIAQLREPRTHLPSIQAIQTKLMDCDSLQHKDMLGYSSVPTQIHKQVWEHLELAKKHREMLKQQQQPQVQVAAVKQEQQDEQEQPQQPQQPPTTKSTRKVLHHDFLYNTDAEFEATLPPAKRRKVVFEDEDEESAPYQQQQIKQEEDPVATMSKAQIDAGIAELVSLMGEADDARRQEYALIQRLVIQIRQHYDQIGSVVSNIKDSHAEIEQHRQAIACKMQQIESIITPVPLPTPATATATAPAPRAMVCNKCTRTIGGNLGGFSVHYADPSHPDNGTIECDECAPLSPASRKFVEEKEAEYEAMAAAAAEATEHPEPEENYYDSDDYYDGYEQACYCGSNNCSIFVQQTSGGGGRGEYDHSEECS
jgi:hypothetical protein